VYVADTGNSTIRKITPAGSVTTFAGSPESSSNVDGVGPAAGFDTPWALATDTAGNVYVADSSANRIRKITPGASVTTLAVGFNAPTGIATDSDANVYVADSQNHIVRKITSAGVISTFAGALGTPDSIDGAATATARFNGPAGIAVVGSGANPTVFVADGGNRTIRRIVAGVVSTLAGTAQAFGSADASGPAASFLIPNGLALDAAGRVYVADTGNHTIRRVTSAGAVSTFSGTAAVQGSADGIGAAASFFGPSGVATDIAGTLYVADKGNRSVRIVTSGGTVSTLSLTGGGFDPQARPQGIAVDRQGNVYVSDSGGAIFKVTPAGVVSTLAGTLGQVGSADGLGATATFNLPAGIATDPAGNLFVADSGNATIRKITTVGDVVTVSTFAGLPASTGSNDGSGSSARFAQPWGLATDDVGNVYVVDRANNNVRKVSFTGAVTTLAGHSLEVGSADGVGSAATFNQPQGIALDGAANVYVADTNNHTVRAITPGGLVSTIAGVAGRRGFAQGPVPGTLADPIGIAIGGSTIYLLMNNGVAAAQ
jgi:sugar lactone lactonase YvrE